jgi:hypothetical protein
MSFLFDPGPPKPLGHQKPHNMRCVPGLNGNGPDGETCRTCKHLVHTGHYGNYLKCGLCRSAWTHGPGTDIKASWPACEKWEKKETK